MPILLRRKSSCETPLMQPSTSTHPNNYSYVNVNLHEEEEGEEGEERIGGRISHLNSVVDYDKTSIDKQLYFVFFGLGLAMLLPFNVFITANSFFKVKFEGGRWLDSFQSFFSLTASVTNMLILIYSLITQRKTQLYQRSLKALLSICIVFLAMVVFTIAPNNYPEFNFLFSSLMLILATFSAALLNSDGLALAASFGPNYVQACLGGQALAGLAPSMAQLLLSILSNDFGSDSSKFQISLQGLGYFGLALIALLITLIQFLKLQKHSKFIDLNNINEMSFEENYNPIQRLKIQTIKCKLLFLEQPQLILALLFTFTVTLSLFPSITTKVLSNSNKNTFFNNYLIELHFLIFNLGDLIGRYLPVFPKTSGWLLLLASLIRFLFIPILLQSNLNIYNNYSSLISDELFLILILAFAITSGYLATIAMTLGPVRTLPEHKETLAALLALTLTIGLSLGSLGSFGVLSIACNCNPF